MILCYTTFIEIWKSEEHHKTVNNNSRKYSCLHLKEHIISRSEENK